MRLLTPESVMLANHGEIFIVPLPGTGFPVAVICETGYRDNTIFFTTLRCPCGQPVYETGQCSPEQADVMGYEEWAEHIRLAGPDGVAVGTRLDFAGVLQSGKYFIG